MVDIKQICSFEIIKQKFEQFEIKMIKRNGQKTSRKVSPIRTQQIVESISQTQINGIQISHSTQNITSQEINLGTKSDQNGPKPNQIDITNGQRRIEQLGNKQTDSYNLNSEALMLNLNDESDFSPIQKPNNQHFFNQANETPGFQKVQTLPLKNQIANQRQPETLLGTPRSYRLVEKPNQDLEFQNVQEELKREQDSALKNLEKASEGVDPIVKAKQLAAAKSSRISLHKSQGKGAKESSKDSRGSKKFTVPPFTSKTNQSKNKSKKTKDLFNASLSPFRADYPDDSHSDEAHTQLNQSSNRSISNKSGNSNQSFQKEATLKSKPSQKSTISNLKSQKSHQKSNKHLIQLPLPIKSLSPENAIFRKTEFDDSFGFKNKRYQQETDQDEENMEDKIKRVLKMEKYVPREKAWLPNIGHFQGPIDEPKIRVKPIVDPSKIEQLAEMRKEELSTSYADELERIRKIKGYNKRQKRRQAMAELDQQMRLPQEYAKEKQQTEDQIRKMTEKTFVEEVIKKYIYEIPLGKGSPKNERLTQSVDVTKHTHQSLPPLRSQRDASYYFADQIGSPQNQPNSSIKPKAPFLSTLSPSQQKEYLKNPIEIYDKTKGRQTRVQGMLEDEIFNKNMSQYMKETRNKIDDANTMLSREFQASIDKVLIADHATNYVKFVDKAVDMRQSPLKLARYREQNQKPADKIHQAFMKRKQEEQKMNEIGNLDRLYNEPFSKNKRSSSRHDSINPAISIQDAENIERQSHVEQNNGEKEEDRLSDQLYKVLQDNEFEDAFGEMADGGVSVADSNLEKFIQNYQPLDARHLRASKELAAGNITAYEKLQVSINRSKTPRKNQGAGQEGFQRKDTIISVVSIESLNKKYANQSDGESVISNIDQPLKRQKALNKAFEEMEKQNEMKGSGDEEDSVIDEEIHKEAGGLKQLHPDCAQEIQRKIEKENEREMKFKMSMMSLQDQRKKIRSLTIQNLDAYLNDFLLGDPNKFAPMLKVHDDLAQVAQFQLPSKEILEFQVKNFRTLITKTRKAHKLELKWLRDKMMQSANDYIKHGCHQVCQDATQEMKTIWKQYFKLREQTVEIYNENEKLRGKLEGHEAKISELTHYVSTLKAQLKDENSKIEQIKIQDDAENKKRCELTKNSLKQKNRNGVASPQKRTSNPQKGHIQAALGLYTSTSMLTEIENSQQVGSIYKNRLDSYMFRDIGKPSPHIQNQRLAAKAVLEKLQEQGVGFEEDFHQTQKDIDQAKIFGQKCECKLSRFDRVRHLFLDQMAQYQAKDQQIQRLKTLTITKKDSNTIEKAIFGARLGVD